MYRDSVDKAFEKAVETWWAATSNEFDSQDDAVDYLHDLLYEALDGLVEEE